MTPLPFNFLFYFLQKLVFWYRMVSLFWVYTSNDICTIFMEKIQNGLELLLLMLIWTHIKVLEEYQKKDDLVKQMFYITVFIFLFLTENLKLEIAWWIVERYLPCKCEMIINAEIGVEIQCFYFKYAEYAKHFHI